MRKIRNRTSWRVLKGSYRGIKEPFKNIFSFVKTLFKYFEWILDHKLWFIVLGRDPRTRTYKIYNISDQVGPIGPRTRRSVDPWMHHLMIRLGCSLWTFLMELYKVTLICLNVWVTGRQRSRNPLTLNNVLCNAESQYMQGLYFSLSRDDVINMRY